MKKFISAALCATLMFSAFASTACSDKDNKKKEPKDDIYYSAVFIDADKVFHQLQQTSDFPRNPNEPLQNSRINSSTNITDDGIATFLTQYSSSADLLAPFLTKDGEYLVKLNYDARCLVKYDYNTETMDYVRLRVRNPDYGKNYWLPEFEEMTAEEIADYKAQTADFQPGKAEFYDASATEMEFLGTLDDGSYVFLEIEPRFDADGKMRMLRGKKMLFFNLDKNLHDAELDAYNKYIDERPDNDNYITVYDKDGIRTSATLICDVDNVVGRSQNLGGFFRNDADFINGIVYVSAHDLSGGSSLKEEIRVLAMTPTGELIGAVDLLDACEEYAKGKMMFSRIIPYHGDKACVVFFTLASERVGYLFDDMAGGGKAEGISLDGSIGGSILRVDENETYYESMYGVYREGADGVPHEVFNLTDIDIGSSLFGVNMAFETIDRIYMIYTDQGTMIPYFVRVDRSETPVHTDKTILCVAYEEAKNPKARPHATTNILDVVSRFNRESQTTRVKLVPYVTDELSTANEKLYRDVISGNTPDMIFFGGTITVDPFLKSKSLIDLYKLMDKDEKFTRGAFFGSVLKPFENNGKLPSLVLNLRYETIAAAADLIGPDTSMSVENFVKIVNSRQNGQYVIKFDKSDAPQYDLFKLILPYILDEYVDSGKKKCDFDKSFKALLEACKDAPVKVVGGNLAPEYYLEGDVIFTDIEIETPSDFVTKRFSRFAGNEMTMCGAPRSDKAKNGTAMFADLSVALTKECADTALAWDFVKYYLESESARWDEFVESPQMMDMSNGIVPTWETAERIFSVMRGCVDYSKLEPTTLANGDEGVIRDRFDVTTLDFDIEKISAEVDLNDVNALDAYIAKLEKNITNIDLTNALRLYRSRRYERGYYPILFTEEDEAVFRDLFENCTVVWSKNDAVKGIILEEVSAYFAGTRSLDDTLKYINDRVKTKLTE